MMYVKSENGNLTEVTIEGSGIKLMAEWTVLTIRLMRTYKNKGGVMSEFCLGEFDKMYKEAKKEAGIEK